MMGQVQELDALLKEVMGMRDRVQRGLDKQDAADSSIGRLRAGMDTHLQALGRYPSFIDVGITVFMDVYDWHVRHRQPIHIARMAEQRFAIQFIATQLVVRWEVPDLNFIGRPRDI
jgi:hypothetical protein